MGGVLYTEQTLLPEEVEVVTLSHLNTIIQNFDSMSKAQIYNNLLDLKDIVGRYTNG